MILQAEYWSGLPSPLPGDTPDPGIKHASLIYASCISKGVFSTSATWEIQMQETGVQSLGREDSLEKEMAPQPRIVAWIIPWTKEPGGLQSMSSQRLGHE